MHTPQKWNWPTRESIVGEKRNEGFHDLFDGLLGVEIK